MVRSGLQCEDNTGGQQPGGAADVGHGRAGEVRRSASTSDPGHYSVWIEGLLWGF